MFAACPGCRVRMTMREQVLCHPCEAKLTEDFVQLLTESAPSAPESAPDGDAA